MNKTRPAWVTSRRGQHGSLVDEASMGPWRPWYIWDWAMEPWMQAMEPYWMMQATGAYWMIQAGAFARLSEHTGAQ